MFQWKEGLIKSGDQSEFGISPPASHFGQESIEQVQVIPLLKQQ
jgi:hypothetical protein